MDQMYFIFFLFSVYVFPLQNDVDIDMNIQD